MSDDIKCNEVDEAQQQLFRDIGTVIERHHTKQPAEVLLACLANQAGRMMAALTEAGAPPGLLLSVLLSNVEQGQSDYINALAMMEPAGRA